MDPGKASPSVPVIASLGEEQPPSKKPRAVNDVWVDEDEKPRKWTVNDVWVDEDDDDEIFGRKFTPEERARYIQQVEDSEGFDIDYIPGIWECGLISPVTNFKKDPSWYNNSRQWSILAIEKYNKDNATSYEFDDVEKLNVQGAAGFHCWVTFRAQDAAKSDTFQAQLFAGIDKVVVKKVQLKKSLFNTVSDTGEQPYERTAKDVNAHGL